ncbi:hypothetical protein INR49_006162 [Caranx melampygus]|nr:hypothetical protein INR49_006162 [Caranx melampygus]
MEAVRPKKTKAKTSGKSQLARKQKQAGEEKRSTASSALCDEASTSGFTDIPLSLPSQEPEEEQQDSFEIPNVPSAPALYPSLPTLEEGPVIQLHEQAVKNSAKGPAVLALPEQESSPPSLQPLESVAELSRSKLYPELPKTAPECQPFSLEQLSVWEPGGGLRAWLEGVEGVCADQSKVCGYHRFQQADFSESVLAELKRLFEVRSELLHQKVALHAYTALLSRLQNIPAAILSLALSSP